jgi:D-alanine-D-alanine ligase
MEKINIALLAGGDSPEREVSLGSAAQVAANLDKEKYNVYLIDVAGRDWTYRHNGAFVAKVDLNDFSLTVGGEHIALDYALIMVHGTPGEDGRVQGYFDFMHIPYSSCGLVSSVVTFDKRICKLIVASQGVNVAREIIIRRGDSVDTKHIVSTLGLPMFVKPNASGSSFGVTKVKSEEAILPAIEAAMREGDTVMIEEFVDGREIACGLIIGSFGEKVFPLTEIIPKSEFFDYVAKYTAGQSDELTPADISDSHAAEIRQMAVTAYKACGCRGIARADFIIPHSGGRPVMIEINSIPGMSAGSIVPKQAAYMGMTLGELFDMVISETYTR